MEHRIVVYRLVTGLVLLLIWWGISFPEGSMMPSPGETSKAAFLILQSPDERARFFLALGETLHVYLFGLFLAALIGVPIGLTLGGFPTVGRTLDVFLSALMATPRVAFIPVIILLLGLFAPAKIFIVFLGAVIPIVVSTYAGVQNVDRELVEMARSVGADRFQIFRRILLPGSLPFVAVGLRLGATIGLVSAVVADFYTAISGLGGLLRYYSSSYRLDHYFVVVICLAMIGVSVTFILRSLELRSERWRYRRE